MVCIGVVETTADVSSNAIDVDSSLFIVHLSVVQLLLLLGCLVYQAVYVAVNKLGKLAIAYCALK
jgi:hypothetical protein